MEEKILSILLDIQNEEKQTKEEVLKLQGKIDKNTEAIKMLEKQTNENTKNIQILQNKVDNLGSQVDNNTKNGSMSSF